MGIMPWDSGGETGGVGVGTQGAPMTDGTEIGTKEEDGAEL